MVDRRIIYTGQIPLDTDQLQQNQDTMVALGCLAEAILGGGTLVVGLACAPTTPASLGVRVARGSIYGLQNLEATAYGSLPADTTHQIVKQGIAEDSQDFACPAPGTSGHSIVYLIQAAYQDVDAGPTVLPYYNASDPSQAYAGPNNSGVSQNTVRRGACLVQVKPGVSATTGTQATPAPDAGFTGLYAVTVANGQSTITSGNIARLANAPFLPATLPALPAAIQDNAWTYFVDGGAANAYAIAPAPAVAAYKAGQKFAFKAAAANTGAPTLNVGGLGPKAVVRRDGLALMPNDIPAGAITEVQYDGVNFQILSASPLHPGAALAFSSGTATAPDGETRYFGQNHILSTAEADVTFRLPFAGRISRLYGYAPSTTAGSRAYTVRKNGADTALAATCAGATPIASNLGDAVDFVAGDEICVKLVTSGGSDVTTHKACVMVERLA